MEIRNPRYNSRGTIDLDMNHPVYGWISFTASPDDVEQYGKLIFENAKAGKYGEVKPYTEE
jgi:hypothetical protein